MERSLQTVNFGGLIIAYSALALSMLSAFVMYRACKERPARVI